MKDLTPPAKACYIFLKCQGCIDDPAGPFDMR